jgi:hypothetical protein
MARIRETIDIVAGRAGRRSLDKLVDANSSCDSVKRPIDSMRMDLEVLVGWDDQRRESLEQHGATTHKYIYIEISIT